MELDSTTWQKLNGRFTYRDVQSAGIHATRRQQGRSPRYIPAFAMNDLQLRAVIAHTAISYIYRGRAVHPDAAHEMSVLDKLVREKTEQSKGFAATNEYWERLQGHFEAIDQAGGYLALVSAVAYRAWRLNWHNSEIAASLAMEKTSVSTILVHLKRVAVLLGYPTTSDMGPRKQRGTDEEILALWKAGRTTGEIHDALGACQQRITKLLKQHGLHYKRQSHNGTPEQIAGLWNQGLGTTQIAAFLGTSAHCVVRHLKMAGLYVPYRTQREGASKCRQASPSSIESLAG